MPRDSGGNVVVNRQPAVSGQTVLAEQVNVPFADIQAMLNLVAWRDGISPWTGSQNANGFRLTNVGDPSSAQDAVTLSYIQTLLDPWALKAVGEFVAYDAGEALTPPPKANALYRYVLLTAGQTGAGAYNESILIDETVSGTDPNIVATAKVNLVNSPLNGKTIRLINTERRFIRPGVGGTLEDSQNLAHPHTINDPGHPHTLLSNIPLPVADFDRGNTGSPSLFSIDNFESNAPTSTNTTGITINSSGGNEARPRSMGVVYYRRIL